MKTVEVRHLRGDCLNTDSETVPLQRRGYTSDLLLVMVMQFFFKLLRRQYTVKTTRVATAMGQLKNRSKNMARNSMS